MTKVYVGDTGTEIVLDCATDISTATARAIKARKPDGSQVTWTATADSATAMKYTTQPTTLDVPGVWALQAEVTTAGGKWLGETAELRVYPGFG